jgi:hypothetical protein
MPFWTRATYSSASLTTEQLLSGGEKKIFQHIKWNHYKIRYKFMVFLTTKLVSLALQHHVTGLQKHEIEMKRKYVTVTYLLCYSDIWLEGLRKTTRKKSGRILSWQRFEPGTFWLEIPKHHQMSQFAQLSVKTQNVRPLRLNSCKYNR